MKAFGKEYLAHVNAAPNGPKIGAFFDFDGTIITGFSAIIFLKEQIKRGELSVENVYDLFIAMRKYASGNCSFADLMDTGAAILTGTSQQKYLDFAAEMYEQQIARRIFPESRNLIEAHRKKGHTVAIISSATAYQLEAAASDLGVEHVLCSHYQVRNGKFTGEIEHPVCFGQGKLDAAKVLSKTHHIDLKQSFFYSDSDDDLALLEGVGHPHTINPNEKLAAIAQRQHWPVHRFTSRGKPSLSTRLRSLAVEGSFVGSYLAGLPLWALNGSKREAQNFSTSLFGDLAATLIGMKLNVRGEENLWKQRPAVVMMNHQSKADSIVMTKLLRQDVAGVGKKEIAQSPILGRVLEYAGTVLIDRKNAASAIEAMKPLIKVLQEEKRSVIIAPEGTRTSSTKLAGFKKGPFHLAMQAGVPIIPVVIHNTIDVCPKHDSVYRPATVDVDVLPPIDTSSWSVETLNEHIAEVRNMYLETLGQEIVPLPLNAPVAKSKRAPKAKPKTTARTQE
ncbi:MAG: HAD-IB family hydrolase [Gammaproteobacteria bacterium]|nr:HAD-IB family hydrolase [Gammaproteobacteria bacterium]